LFVRMFTKIGVTLATGTLPVLLWAGAAGAQQSPETSQSQSQSQTSFTTPVTTPTTTDNGGVLARTGVEDVLPLAIGGAALAGAVAFRSVRRRSVT
jgi:hypothetical protein